MSDSAETVTQEQSKEWGRSSISDLCDVIRGVTYKKALSSDTPAKNRLPILRATNIQDARLVLDRDLVYVPEELVSEKQRLKSGDIVIATSSGSKHLVGKTAQVKEPWEGSFGAFCAAVRPKVDINSRYLGYFFESPEYKKFIAARAMGVNINNLRRGDLEEISVPIAPRDQQDRIVAEIEKQFSRLDEAVASLKRVKANLKRYKAAVLKAAVEGKLTEEWRKQNPDVEPASKLLERILAERRTKWEETELAKMKAKGKEPKNDKWKDKYKKTERFSAAGLQELPAGWVWARTKDVGSIQLGRQRSPKYHNGPNMKPYLRVKNVYEDHIDTSDVMEMDFPPSDFEKYVLSYGDILLNEGQSPEFLGRPAMYRDEVADACFTNTLIRYRPYSPIEPEYPLLVFRAYMRSGRFTKEGTITTNIAHLSAARFAEIEFPVPPLREQHVIANIAAEAMSVLQVLESQVDKNFLRSARLRSAILEKEFSGDLR